MRKRIILLTAIFVALAAAIYLFKEATPEGPQCNGHSLRYWVSSLTHNTQADQLAIGAIQHLNTNALPFLLKWIQRETPQSRYNLAVKVAGVFPQKLFWPIAHAISGRSHDGFAAKAQTAFGFLGTNAVSAIPDLTKMMNNPTAPQTARRATIALGSIGTNSFPILLQALQNPQHPRRIDATEAVRIMVYQPIPATMSNQLFQVAPEVFLFP